MTVKKHPVYTQGYQGNYEVLTQKTIVILVKNVGQRDLQLEEIC